MNPIKWFRRIEMNREITLTVRSILYSEPTPYDKDGCTEIKSNPFLFDREEIRVDWKLKGKRDDIKIGQKFKCSLSLILDEE